MERQKSNKTVAFKNPVFGLISENEPENGSVPFEFYLKT